MWLLLLRSSAGLALAVACALGASSMPEVRAGGPAASDVLPVVMTVDVATRLGGENVILVGRLHVDQAAARDDGGHQVIDLTVPEIALQGASRLGVINVSARSDGEHASTGELRSVGTAGVFPASSFLSLFFDVSAPASPFGPLSFHNEASLTLRPRSGGAEVAVQSWPPRGLQFGLDPVYLTDNDGDGEIDEDSADEDGDLLVDEDRPGPDPATPGVDACGDDADCDGVDGEDQPAAGCPPATCDEDGDGLTDEDPACLPLLNETGTHLKLALCVRNVTMLVAPAEPSYSVIRGGRGVFHPADVFGLLPAGPGAAAQPPFVRIPCAALGLTADGCDDGADGDQDDVDALSFGNDLDPGASPGVEFSVAPGALGLDGTAVRAQVMCPPAEPGLAPEPEPDVFRSAFDAANTQVFDGNGPVGACAGAFPIGLVEAASAHDDLDALDMSDASAVDGDGDGVPEGAVYFSLDAASPSLGAFGASAGDVLRTAGGVPEVYASASMLGLQAGDDIDALCLPDGGDGAFGEGDALLFSLRAGSPTLLEIAAGPGDLLAPGQPLAVLREAGQLGLAAGDDVDALDCGAAGQSTQGNGDVDCNGATDAVDALRILEYHSGLSATPPCLGSADASQDSLITSVDALLVLQFAAGMIPHLPR